MKRSIQGKAGDGSLREYAWSLYEVVPPVSDALPGRVRLAVVTNRCTDFRDGSSNG